MRIVSGEFRGKTLVTPAGAETRPTSDRARQAVFNILEHAPWSAGVRDRRVMDLFAGSGALGFEALSRGATDLGVRPGADGPAFDLAFLDPPYAKRLGEQALAKLAAGGWLAPEAIVVFERGAGEPAFEAPGYEALDVRDYGAARVHFLRFKGA